MSELSTAADSTWTSAFCPYVGLAPFEESHKDYYFGRRLDAQILADNALSSNITVVYGASGVGKTSLLNVGLTKALEEMGRPAPVVTLRKWQGRLPLEAVREALKAVDVPCADQQRKGGPESGDREDLEREPTILVLDQFEEYFVYQGGESAASFEEELGAIAGDPESGIHLVISIRQDRYHVLDRLRIGIPELLDNTLELKHLDANAVEEAVVGPVRVYNERFRKGQVPVSVQDGFVKRLLVSLKQVEMAGPKGARQRDADTLIELPYLQLALEKIWASLHPARSLKLDEGLLRTLSVSRIVETHVDDEMSALTPEEQGLCAQIFDRMVTPTGAKIALSAEELAGFKDVKASVEQVEAALERLASGSSRVVTPVASPGERPAYELFHDVLGGPVLAWKDRYLERQRARRAKRKAMLYGGAALLMFGLAAVFWFLLIKANEAEQNALEKQIRLLTALSREELRQGRPVQAMLLALKALPRSPDDTRTPSYASTQATLWRALMANHEFRYLKGHSEVTHIVAYSPDGSRLATTSADETTKIWNVATGRLILTLKGHEKEVIGVSFGLDGQRLATTSEDETVRLWNAETGKQLASAGLAGETDLSLFPAFSPDGRQLVVFAEENKSVVLLDAETGRVLRTFADHRDIVIYASFSSDGRRLATTSEDKTARIWDVETGKLLFSLTGHEDSVISASFSPDGSRLATTSSDKTIRLWDVQNGEMERVFRGHDDTVVKVGFGLDGRRIATSSADGTVRLWDSETGKPLATIKLNKSEVSDELALLSVFFSADGRRLAVPADGGKILILDARTGRTELALHGAGDELVWFSFSGDGSRLAATSGERVLVWDTGTGTLLATLAHDDRAIWVQFSPDGESLATTSEDGTARIWRVATPFARVVYETDGAPIGDLAFDPHGRWLATTSPLDPHVLIWDLWTGRPRTSLKGQEGRPDKVKFGPGGKQIAASIGYDDEVQVWDVESGDRISTLKGHYSDVTDIRFSPDGRRVATASEDGTARIWDARSGKSLAVLEGEAGAVKSVAFSPDSERLVTAETCGVEPPLPETCSQWIRIWDARSGKMLQSLLAPPADPALDSEDSVCISPVLESATFSPDGRFVIAKDGCLNLRVWYSETGDEDRIVDGNERGYVAVVADPDGGTDIVGPGSSGRVCLWSPGTNSDCGSGVVPGDESVIGLSPNGGLFLSTGSDGIARIRKTESGEELAELQGGMHELVSAYFAADGESVAARDDVGRAWVWEASTGRVIASLDEHRIKPQRILFALKGRRIAVRGEAGGFWLWDTENKGLIGQFSGLNAPVVQGLFSVSPDGGRILYQTPEGSHLVYDAATGKQLLLLDEPGLKSASFSPDGRRLAAAGRDYKARVWNVATGTEELVLDGNAEEVVSVAFSPDGSHLVTASVDGSARVWDALSGKTLITLDGLDEISTAAFSPGGRFVVTEGSSDNERKLWVWDAATGTRVLESVSGESLYPLTAVFSPKDDRLVTFRKYEAMLWNLQEGGTPIGLKTDAAGALFHPEGDWLVTYDRWDNEAKVWDAHTGKEMTVLEGHTGNINAMAFNPGGSRLASASTDGTVRIWDPESGQSVAVLDSHEGPVTGVTYSADGSRLASASEDGSVHVWPVFNDLWPLIEAARTSLSRQELTKEERARFFLPTDADDR